MTHYSIEPRTRILLFARNLSRKYGKQLGPDALKTASKKYCIKQLKEQVNLKETKLLLKLGNQNL